MSLVRGEIFKAATGGPYYYHVRLNGVLNKVSVPQANANTAHNNMTADMQALVTSISEPIQTETIEITTGN